MRTASRTWLAGASSKAERRNGSSGAGINSSFAVYRDLDGKSGVYVIREGSEIVYVGESHTNRLYDTLTRHFQQVRHEAQEAPMT